jgi:hypothetical protein
VLLWTDEWAGRAVGDWGWRRKLLIAAMFADHHLHHELEAIHGDQSKGAFPWVSCLHYMRFVLVDVYSCFDHSDSFFSMMIIVDVD